MSKATIPKIIVKHSRPLSRTTTITYGDCAENHVGMQQLGQRLSSGFSYDDIVRAKKMFEERGCICELIHLNSLLPADTVAEDAWLLLARNGVSALVNDTADQLMKEHDNLTPDTKAKMRGRVVNKLVRHNLCFAEIGQEADFENGRGTVVSFQDIPITNSIRKALPNFLGQKAQNLVAEGNYYYDISRCGIRFHGDTERRIVVAVRLGASLPLHYQWYLQRQRIGHRFKETIHHGDVYVMSDKATGYDWKRIKIPTLRHAAGSDSFVDS